MRTMSSGVTAPAGTAPRPGDRYPSRMAAEPSIIPRLDPVVHGKSDDGPLSAADLAFFDQHGYLDFQSLLSPQELLPCLTELDRLRTDESIRTTPEVVIEPDSHALRSIFAVHQHQSVLAALCAHPRLVAIARQLLGSDVYIHQSRINYKGGFRGREFYWHSDFETWHVEDGMPAMRAVSCSVSLTPNTPHNGPLMLVPGSHRYFVACVGETPQDHYKASLRRQEVGVPDEASLAQLIGDFGLVAPIGPAGSVTFFDCNVMHGSNSNITSAPRSNVFTVYNSVDNQLEAPFCGLQPRPNFIAERDDFRPVPAIAERPRSA